MSRRLALRRWFYDRRDIVELPSEVRSGRGCIRLDSTTRLVPIVDLNTPPREAEPSREHVVGYALFVRKRRDGICLYRTSVPVRGRGVSGGWRNRGAGLALVEIALLHYVPGFPVIRRQSRLAAGLAVSS